MSLELGMAIPKVNFKIKSNSKTKLLIINGRII